MAEIHQANSFYDIFSMESYISDYESRSFTLVNLNQGLRFTKVYFYGELL